MLQSRQAGPLPPMNESSEWLKIMLGEIARKQTEDREASEEAARRDKPNPSQLPDSST